MADTFTQIFYHVVFSVRNRRMLITDGLKEDLYKYVSGIVKNQGQNLFIINGMPDQVYMLLNCRPNISLSNLIMEVKEHSSRFINEKKIFKEQFHWQAGSGAFSVSKNDVENVIRYIKNQEAYHRVKSFREEYVTFLIENAVDYRKEYLFDSD